MKRILIAALAGFVLLNLAAAVLGAVFYFKFFPQIPAPAYPDPTTPAEARAQDLDYLRLLPAFDNSFSAEEKARFSRWLDGLSGRAAEMSDAEFVMGVARAAAIAGNGHTNLRLRPALNTLNSLPVRFFWFEEGLFITRARKAQASLIGARVISYELQDPADLLVDLKPYLGGAFSYFKFQSPSLFASRGAMHAAGLAAEAGSARLTVALPSGEIRDIRLSVEETATPFMPETRNALPAGFETEAGNGAEWTHLDPPRGALSFYSRASKQSRWRDTLPEGGAYIRLRWILGDSETSLTGWLQKVTDDLAGTPADYLVLDLRSNYGGDYTKSMSFARGVRDLVKPGGTVYVLTDGGTFSAALVTAAFAKHAAGRNAVMAGTRLGDFEQFWAEGGGLLRLPNSRLGITLATAYHDWKNGCTDWSRCYWLNILFGVGAGKLDPDLRAPLTFEGYAQGRDDTMAAILVREGAAPTN